jgi:hypothetical protein
LNTHPKHHIWNSTDNNAVAFSLPNAFTLTQRIAWTFADSITISLTQGYFKVSYAFNFSSIRLTLTITWWGTIPLACWRSQWQAQLHTRQQVALKV